MRVAVCGQLLTLVSVVEDELRGPLCNLCAGHLLGRGQARGATR